MSFGGFDLAAVELLSELPSFSQSQYLEARAGLVQGLRSPGIALVETLARALDPCLHVDRRSSVSPFHTDLRFAKPGGPRYKDHLLLTTWHGSDRKTAPMLWIRIDSHKVGFASGMAFNAQARARWRQAIGGAPGEVLDGHLRALCESYKTREFEVSGAQVKNVPKPWPQDHARAELLRRTGFQVRFQQPLPDTITEASFANWCERRLRDLLPVHHWLVAQLCSNKAGV